VHYWSLFEAWASTHGSPLQITWCVLILLRTDAVLITDSTTGRFLLHSCRSRRNIYLVWLPSSSRCKTEPMIFSGALDLSQCQTIALCRTFPHHPSISRYDNVVEGEWSGRVQSGKDVLLTILINHRLSTSLPSVCRPRYTTSGR
jgi:hypothetical protein